MVVVVSWFGPISGKMNSTGKCEKSISICETNLEEKRVVRGRSVNERFNKNKVDVFLVANSKT